MLQAQYVTVKTFIWEFINMNSSVEMEKCNGMEKEMKMACQDQWQMFGTHL